MAKRPWYKRYPSDAIASKMMLSAEEKGVFDTILDLIYDRGGPVPNEPRDLARISGCSTRRFNQILSALIEKHDKIFLTEDGSIMNRRAEKELENSRKSAEKLAENGAKGAEKTNEKRAASQENNDLDEKGPLFSGRPIPDTRDQKPERENISQSIDDDFRAFYSAYPRKKGRGQAEKAYRSARKTATAEELLAGARRLAADSVETDPQFIPYPATWLNGKRWLDEPPAAAGIYDAEPWEDQLYATLQ